MDGKYSVQKPSQPRIGLRHRLPVYEGAEYVAISTGLRDHMIEPEFFPEWCQSFYRRDLTEIFPG
jgi:hypothetical protein